MHRILIITSNFPPRPDDMDGNYIVDQAQALQHVGAKVHVLVASPWVPAPMQRSARGVKSGVDIAAYAALGLTVSYHRFFRLPRNLLGALAFPIQAHGLWPAIRDRVAADSVNVLHSHDEFLAYASAKAALRLGIPHLVTLHGINPVSRWIDTTARRACVQYGLDSAKSVSLVGSGGPMQHYIKRHPLTGNHYRLLTNGVTDHHGSLPPSRVPRSRPLRIVSAGNLWPSKGFDCLIRAIGRLKQMGNNEFELVCVGDGMCRPELESMALELGIVGEVHFTGRLSHPRTLGEIAAADVFCLPSSWEACGLVHLEAMSLGKPTIGCLGQGPQDYITHGNTGYLVPPNDVDRLAKQLAEICADMTRAQEIGDAAKRFVRAQLTWGHYAQRLLRLYDEAARPQTDRPAKRTRLPDQGNLMHMSDLSGSAD
jgi:teichuronic acid biosynthesis glycosyltransferase TuaC